MGVTVTSNKGEERFHGGCGVCLSRAVAVLNGGGNVDLAGTAAVLNDGSTVESMKESRGGAE